MRGYATITGTRRNLDALQRHGWCLLVSPDTLTRAGWRRPCWTDGTPAHYALDNGAWGAFNSGKPWDVWGFVRACISVGAGADWLVLPDVVGDAPATFQRASEWYPLVKAATAGTRPLLALQDGMTPEMVAPWVRRGCGLFLGGSTAWKLKTLPMWGDWASRWGCYYHVGRVNSARRIRYCRDVGADSFDGTSCTRFAVNTPRLTRAIRHPQLSIWGR